MPDPKFVETYVKQLDDTFKVRQTNNAAIAMMALNPDDLYGVMRSLLVLIAPEDHDRFKTSLLSQDNLPADQIAEMFAHVFEVAAGGRPTKRTSGSGRTTAKKVATKRSAES